MYEIDKNELEDYGSIDIYFRGKKGAYGLFIPKNSGEDLKKLNPQQSLYVSREDRVILIKKWIRRDVNNVSIWYEEDFEKSKEYLLKVAKYFFLDKDCSIIEESKYFISSMATMFEHYPDMVEKLLFLDEAEFSIQYHNINVMLYCMDFATKNNRTKDEIIVAGLTGFLHDIGKIDIAQEILMKKDQLTKREFSEIKNHPRYGIRVLKDCKVDDRIIDVVWEHHERLDGSGYPRGKFAESLGVHSRLLGIIDSFDALTSQRPYKKRSSIMSAFKILKEDADRGKYDTMILKQFAKCFIGTDL
jgi:HD-GYP domain-containing protein (c-di-GMP phosphodiesterase class II)